MTLGTTVSGADVFFLSAVTPAVNGFTFRATDKGASIVDPASAKLTIDGKVVTLTPKKAGDATDFTYTASPAFALDSNHPYSIQVKDTLGNTVTDQGTFKIGSFKVGLNFGADQANGTLTAGTDVAGVPAVVQGYWNNLSGATSAPVLDADGNPTGALTPTIALSDQGANAFTTINVTWEANGTWASTGAGEENNAFTGADQILMTGYLDTGDATTTKVTLTGIPPEFTALGYDLYVYTLGGAPGDGGGYRIVSTNGTVLKDYVLFTNGKNPATYTEVPQGAARGTGNYIVFKGLTAPAIVVEATTQSPQGAGTEHRAPINAIQLVPSASKPAGDVKLSAKKTAAGIEITYDGTLQSSATVNGAYTDVAGATSPYTTQTSGAAKFYRAKQ